MRTNIELNYGQNLGTILYVVFVWFLPKNTSFLDITKYKKIMDLNFF